MACASTAERPKASGSVEGTVTTDAAGKAAGISVQWPTRRTMSLQAAGRDQPVELLHVGDPALRVPSEDEADIGEAGIPQLGRGFHKHLLAFPAREAGGEEHNALMRRHPPGLAKGLDPLGRDRGRREHAKIGAAVDHPDAAARREDRPSGSIRRVMRIRDDGVAARHD